MFVLSKMGNLSCFNLYRTHVIYYRQGDARLDEDYRQNGVHLSSVLDALRRLADGSPDAVRRLEIVSGASPEGRADFNLH